MALGGLNGGVIHTFMYSGGRVENPFRSNVCNMTSSEGSSRLIAALERRSDIELRLSCGKSIRAHSQKLSLASSVLGDLIDAVMDEQITAMRAAKRRRDDEGTSDDPQTLPHITVSLAYYYRRILLP